MPRGCRVHDREATHRTGRSGPSSAVPKTMHTYDNDQVARRYEELAHLESAGVPAYPYAFGKTHSTAAARSQYQDDAPELNVAIAGRIVAIRKMGKATFLHVQDDS